MEAIFNRQVEEGEKVWGDFKNATMEIQSAKNELVIGDVNNNAIFFTWIFLKIIQTN